MKTFTNKNGRTFKQSFFQFYCLQSWLWKFDGENRPISATAGRKLHIVGIGLGFYSFSYFTRPTAVNSL